MAYKKASIVTTWFDILDEFAAFCVANSGGMVTRSPDTSDHVVLKRNGLVFLFPKVLVEYKPALTNSTSNTVEMFFYAAKSLDVKVKYPTGAMSDWSTRMTFFNFTAPYISAHFFANKHDCSIVVEVGEKQYTHFSFGQAESLDPALSSVYDFATGSNFCVGYFYGGYSNCAPDTFNYGWSGANGKDQRSDIGAMFPYCAPFVSIAGDNSSSTFKHIYCNDEYTFTSTFKNKSWVRYANTGDVNNDTKHMQMLKAPGTTITSTTPDKGLFGTTVSLSLKTPPYFKPSSTDSYCGSTMGEFFSWRSAINKFSKRAILRPIYFTNYLADIKRWTIGANVKGVRLVRLDFIEPGSVQLGEWMCFPLVTKIERPCENSQPNRLGVSTADIGYAYYMGDFA